MATQLQIQQLTDELNGMTAVPIIAGYDGTGWIRFDFKAPLEEHELRNIENSRKDLLMIFNCQTVYLRKLL